MSSYFGIPWWAWWIALPAQGLFLYGLWRLNKLIDRWAAWLEAVPS